MSVDWTKPLQLKDGTPVEFMGVLEGVDYTHVCKRWVYRAGLKPYQAVTTYTAAGEEYVGCVGNLKDVINVPEVKL